MTPTDQFISKAKAIHGEEYDYSQTSYLNAKTKVEVICAKHGIFHITPNNHLRGVRCKKCSMGEAGLAKRKTASSFVTDAVSIHGDKYDYSKVSYATAHTPVEIRCHKHGVFVKTPNMHLKGQGCPRCSDRFKTQNAWLDFVGVPNDQAHRQVPLIMYDGTRIVADGFDPLQKIVYEFWGDKWHGNLSRLLPSDRNPKTKLTYQEHWDLTQHKINRIRSSGFKLIHIWESQWSALVRVRNHEVSRLLRSIYAT